MPTLMPPRRDLLRAARLPRAWFARDALHVARALIGCLLVDERDSRVPRAGEDVGSDGNDGSGGPRVARIVETEAYRGPRDLACHARAGLTARTRTLLGAEGHAYVFLIYGMHECFNVTCRGLGAGHAVLIRAAEPVAGFAPGIRLDGPGRFTRGFRLSRADDGRDLTEPPLYLCPREKRPKIATTARVGVAYAGTWADASWRFFDRASQHVSKPPKKAIGRG